MLNLDQLFIYFFIFLIGLCFGSFLNVIIYRLPRCLSLVQPSSHCPYCDQRLGFADLIPLFGYLVLRGRCHYCGAKISLRYPLVELATGLLFLLVFSYFSLSLNFIFYLTLLYLLLGIALIDLEHRIVPNRVIAAGLIAGLLCYLPQLVALWLSVPTWMIVRQGLVDALAGMLLGAGIMLVIFIVSRGGMGAGDIKLMAMIGFYVGLHGTAVVLLLAFIFGSIVGLTFMALGKLTRKDALPFAPFLALAALVEVLWGTQIWNWYVRLLG